MNKLKKLTAAALLVTAFSTPSLAVDNSTVGTLLGGAGGAAIGSQFGKGNGQLVGVAIGTLLGAGIGNSVGTSMDRADSVYYGQPTRRVEVREQWSEPRHPGRGHYKKWHKHKEPRYVQRNVYVDEYAYAEPATYNQPSYGNANSGQYCREYTSPVVVGGVKQSSYGTACYMPDGSWQIQNGN